MLRPFSPCHWNLAVPVAFATLACTPSIPSSDDGESATTETGDPVGDGDGDGDGDGEGDGDGDGDDDDPPTTGNDDDCSTNADCEGNDVCYMNMCVEPLGDCYSDNDCPNGICDYYYYYNCIEIDALPECDSPESLVELPIPEEVDDVLPLQIAMGDVDGNGDDDILIANSFGITTVFVDTTVFSALGPWLVDSMTAFDLGDDGNLDLAVWRESTLEIYAGDGTGNFVLLESFASELGKVETLLRFDADGDDDDDLIAGADGSIGLWFNEAGVMTPMTSIDAGWHKLAVADFGDDGQDEFISGDEASLSIYSYQPPWMTFELVDDPTWSYSGLAPVQQAGETPLGVLGVVDRYDTSLLHGWSVSDFQLLPVQDHGLLRLPGDSTLLTAGDFDGDGISTGFAYGGNSVSILIRLGSSMDEHCHTSLIFNTERAVVGDVDGDGNDEIAMVLGSKLRLYGAP